MQVGEGSDEQSLWLQLDASGLEVSEQSVQDILRDAVQPVKKNDSRSSFANLEWNEFRGWHRIISVGACIMRSSSGAGKCLIRLHAHLSKLFNPKFARALNPYKHVQKMYAESAALNPHADDLQEYLFWN